MGGGKGVSWFAWAMKGDQWGLKEVSWLFAWADEQQRYRHLLSG